MQVPTTLNGYPVVRSRDHGNGYATVMVRRATPDPYVVATWHTGLTHGWVWGHYDLADLPDATRMFGEVANRNARRG